MLTILAATGVIITAAYHLWALQRMFLGKFREEWRQSQYLEPFGGKFPEINAREIVSPRAARGPRAGARLLAEARCSTLIDKRRARSHRASSARPGADRTQIAGPRGAAE